MKVRNLVLGLMLGVTVFNAHSTVMATGGTAAAVSIATMARTNATIASSVTSKMMNSQNTVIVECPLEYERVKKNDEWIGTVVPSLKKTLNTSYCQSNKKTMEQLNNTHDKFGKVMSIFEVRQERYVTIELVEVNE